MRVIIAGCGRVGSRLANLLSYEGHNIVVIDRDARAFHRLEMPFNGMTMTGMAFDEALLMEAGIEEADAFAALTNYDNTNLMAAEIASSLYGVPRVIARVYNPDKEPTYRTMGIDYLCGSTMMAEVFHRAVTTRGALLHLDRGGGFQVFEVEVGAASEGLKISEIRGPGMSRLMTLVRGEKPVYFNRDTRLVIGDRLLLAVSGEGRAHIEKFAPLALQRLRLRGGMMGAAVGEESGQGEKREWRVIVAGCGRVGAQLSEMLSLDGYRVAVIDRDAGAFEKLSKSFQGEVFPGMAFDLDAMEDAGIKSSDVFAAVTNFDNTNLMAAEVARKIYGVGKVVSRLYNPDKGATYQALDIDYICGTVLLAEQFMQRIVQARVNVLAWTANNRVLLVEFICPARLGGKAVNKLEGEEMMRVGLIARDGETMVAARDTVLKKGDRVVAAVLERRLNKFRRLVGHRRGLDGGEK